MPVVRTETTPGALPLLSWSIRHSYSAHRSGVSTAFGKGGPAISRGGHSNPWWAEDTRLLHTAHALCVGGHTEWRMPFCRAKTGIIHAVWGPGKKPFI